MQLKYLGWMQQHRWLIVGSIAGLALGSFLIVLPTQAAIIESLSAPCTECGKCTFDDALIIIRNLFNLIIDVLGPLSVLGVLIGGFLLTISAGNPELADRGRRTIRAAMAGAGLVVGAWVIVNTVISVLVDDSTIFGKEWFSISTVPNPGTCEVVHTPGTPISPVGVDPSGWVLSPELDPRQVNDASAELASLIDCLYARVSGGVTISSISDDHIYSGACDLSSCNDGAKGRLFCPANGECSSETKCQHRCGSCHYTDGVLPGTGFSKAVDVIDLSKENEINYAISQCGGGARVLREGGEHPHLHIAAGSCGSIY